MDLHMVGDAAPNSKAASKPEYSGAGGEIQMTGEQAGVSSAPTGVPFDNASGDLHMVGEQSPLSHAPSSPWTELPVVSSQEKV